MLLSDDREKIINNPKEAFDSLVKFFTEHPECSSMKFAKLPYDVFLETPYWFVVSTYKKHLVAKKYKGSDGKQHEYIPCQYKNCINTGVDVHHIDYSISGQEHIHLDKLLVLCRKCHEAWHKGYREENACYNHFLLYMEKEDKKLKNMSSEEIKLYYIKKQERLMR